MEREISDGFWVGVECCAAVILLFMLFNIMSASRTMYSSFEEQQATTQRLQEARQWNAYNDKTVYSTDIISLYNKFPVGDEPSNLEYHPQSGSTVNLKTLTSAQVEALITADKYYKCTIVRNPVTQVVTTVVITQTDNT